MQDIASVTTCACTSPADSDAFVKRASVKCADSSNTRLYNCLFSNYISCWIDEIYVWTKRKINVRILDPGVLIITSLKVIKSEW